MISKSNQDNYISDDHPFAKKRIVVAMSGGVDSSVAAAMLVAQGHEVIGMMMRLWSEPAPDARIKLNRCCTPDQIADARRVANSLHIPFYVLDVQEYFRQQVVQYFIEEHALGRTPNPCVQCNRHIRFNYLLGQALALEADYLATGHYARIGLAEGGFQLLQARDKSKDQSYVLHVLTQKELAHVMFPIGDYTKEEVRHIADRFGLTVAAKKESMDLCFLSDGDYRRFLRDNAPNMNIRGPIFSVSGEKLGQHSGLANYTIGQRKGLGVALGQPTFVVRKDSDNNALIVGTKEQATRTQFATNNLNWIAGRQPSGPFQAQVKIRYRSMSTPATVTPVSTDHALVHFNKPAFGVTAGQAAVFYCDEVCLGGGIIADEESK